MENTKVNGVVWDSGTHHLYVDDKPTKLYVPPESIKDTYNQMKMEIKQNESIPIGIDHLNKETFKDNPTIVNNQLTGRSYPYRTYIGFAGEMNIIPQDDIYVLQHTGNSQYTSKNLILFEDGLTDYAAEFDFKIISMSQTSTPNNSINLWVLKGANDGLTYVTVSLSFKNNNNTSISIITYKLGKPVSTTAETLLKNNLTQGKTYKIEIKDNGQKITVLMDNEIVLKNVSYNAPLIPPGYWKGWGAQEKNSATWTNIKIIPPEKYPEYFGKNNHFILPSQFKRNQPIHIEYTEQGGGIRYTTSTFPNTGGMYLIGPADLNHQVGLISRITIEGNSNTTMEISGIDYQYTP
jgi:hypothetical protein